MEDLKYRKSSRIIGFVDLILSFLLFWPFITICIVLLAMFPLAALNLTTHSFKSVVSALLVYLIVTVALVLMLAQIYAAWKLIKATEVGIDPIEGINHAKFWRTSAILNAILPAIGAVVTLMLEVFNPISLIVFGGRCGLIWVVHRFIKELEVLVFNIHINVDNELATDETYTAEYTAVAPGGDGGHTEAAEGGTEKDALLQHKPK